MRENSPSSLLTSFTIESSTVRSVSRITRKSPAGLSSVYIPPHRQGIPTLIIKVITEGVRK